MDALDFSDLRVVLESCTLKRSPEVSHTAGLMTVRARNTRAHGVVMTWNLMHLTAMLERGGGIPSHGNRRDRWDAGVRFDHPNPGYR